MIIKGWRENGDDNNLCDVADQLQPEQRTDHPWEDETDICPLCRSIIDMRHTDVTEVTGCCGRFICPACQTETEINGFSRCLHCNKIYETLNHRTQLVLRSNNFSALSGSRTVRLYPLGRPVMNCVECFVKTVVLNHEVQMKRIDCTANCRCQRRDLEDVAHIAHLNFLRTVTTLSRGFSEVCQQKLFDNESSKNKNMSCSSGHVLL